MEYITINPTLIVEINSQEEITDDFAFSLQVAAGKIPTPEELLKYKLVPIKFLNK